MHFPDSFCKNYAALGVIAGSDETIAAGVNQKQVIAGETTTPRMTGFPIQPAASCRTPKALRASLNHAFPGITHS
jgi:hypothetical protein